MDAVNGRIPVLIDGGVRRGTDVLKALGLGASAVGIFRPYVWGLASFGEAGVDRVLEILDDEFITIMRQVGALNINQITRDNVTRAHSPAPRPAHGRATRPRFWRGEPRLRSGRGRRALQTGERRLFGHHGQGTRRSAGGSRTEPPGSLGGPLDENSNVNDAEFARADRIN